MTVEEFITDVRAISIFIATFIFGVSRPDDAPNLEETPVPKEIPRFSTKLS